MKIRNIVLFDFADTGEFMCGFERKGMIARPLVCRGEVSVPKFKRLLNFLFFPLWVALRYPNVEKIIAWQQYYGIFYSIYAWLLGKRKIDVTIMTFIFRKKNGMLGKLHHGLVNFALTRKIVKNVIVYSRHEVDLYSRQFSNAAHKFRFERLGVSQTYKVASEPEMSGYLLAVGVSNRDYSFLLKAMTEINEKLIVLCPGIKPLSDNVTVLENVYGAEMLGYLQKCKAVVIPLANSDVSSGQLSLIEALRMGKPTIVSRNSSLMDYVIDGETSLVIDNNKQSLASAIEYINQEDNYKRMSAFCKKYFRDNLSIESLAGNICDLA